MRHIVCRACGKRYDYNEDGCCPECGAYNRPPRRVQVDADGQIHAAGGDKVCYEQKTCFEEQARPINSRRKTSMSYKKEAEYKRPTVERPAPQQSSRPAADRPAQPQSAPRAAYGRGRSAPRGKGGVILIGVIIFMVAVISNIVSSCRDSSHDYDYDYDYNTPYDTVQPDTDDQGRVWQDVYGDDIFYWHGKETKVEYATDMGDLGDGRKIFVTVNTTVSSEEDMPSLMVDGERWTLYAPSTTMVTANGYVYIYVLPTEVGENYIWLDAVFFDNEANLAYEAYLF